MPKFVKGESFAVEAGRKGGKASSGNFARNIERAKEAGRKGGAVSGGNFANNLQRARTAALKSVELRRAKKTENVQ